MLTILNGGLCLTSSFSSRSCRPSRPCRQTPGLRVLLAALIFLLFLLFALSLNCLLALAADELDQGKLGAIALTTSELENASVATRPVGKALSELTGQLLKSCYAGGPLRILEMLLAFGPCIAREEVAGGKTCRMQCGTGLTGFARSASPASKGHGALGEWPELLGLWQRRHDALVDDE